MKKFKKALLSILSLALVAVLSIGGTIAYLTSEDSDVNVMTMGNVKIAQHEYERVINEDGSYKTATIDNQTSYVLKEFTQDKPLYPAVADPNTYPSGYDSIPVRMSQVKSYGGMSVFNEPNAQDKFVTVENTGRSDAYIRTLIAIEIGEGNSDLIGINLHTRAWDIEGIGEIEVDNNKYYLFEFVYAGAQLSDGSWRHENGVLPAKDTTYPSLSQVYLKTEATNEDCEALDGNGNGRLDILVLSQAVQTSGFADAKTALDRAFGKSEDKAAEWFETMPRGFKVSNSAELAEAIAAGETEIYLNKGEYNMPAAAKGKTLTINGTKDSVIKVKPAGQGEAGGQLDYSLDGSTVTFNGVTIKTNGQLFAGFARLSATYNDCVIQNTYNLGVGTSVFNNCVFNITNEYLRVGGAYSAEFNNCTFNTDGRAILVYQDGTYVDQTVTVKDCTFNATAPAYTWNGIHVAAVSFDGRLGGTYTVKFEGNNVVDSDFKGLWQVKDHKDNNYTVSGN